MTYGLELALTFSFTQLAATTSHLRSCFSYHNEPVGKLSGLRAVIAPIIWTLRTDDRFPKDCTSQRSIV